MKTYDILGIGIGPSNLSTAALLHPYSGTIQSMFFDEKPEFNWYPGMLFPDATIQVSILKDLVTMVDPSNEFSFLNFLKKNGRLYLFASKGYFDNLKRKEFVQYFQWVVNSLPNLNFSSPVDLVDYDKGKFHIIVNRKKYTSHNLLMGAGNTAHIPECCKKYVGHNIVHSSQFLSSNLEFTNKRIMVVGGGQSGAEVVLHLFKDEKKLPSSVQWINSEYNFLPMEDTPFSNELYTPHYSNYFYQLCPEDKQKLIAKQKYTSDGISEHTLQEIYELLYNNRFLNDIHQMEFYPGSYLTNVSRNSFAYETEITLKNNNQTKINQEVDIIVLATGFKYTIPKFIEPLTDYLSIRNGKFDIAEDFSIVTKKPMEGKVYIHNGAKHVRGVADPNLSLVAWRSAKIINSFTAQSVYDTENDQSLLNWNKMANPPRSRHKILSSEELNHLLR
jgi:lysine N6-hydroxylase